MLKHHFPAALVSLTLLSMSCAHYNLKKPNFVRGSNGTLTVDASGRVVKASSIPAPKPGTLPAISSEANTLPTPIKDAMNPDPLMGAGTRTTPVPSPVMSKTPAHVAAPRHTETYSEAITAIDAAKNNDPNLKNFWVGGGYDVLTGSRTPTCMEPTTIRTTVTRDGHTYDTQSIAHDQQELYNMVDKSIGVDIGAVWDIFGGKVSVKTSIMNETQMTSDDVVMIANYSYFKDKIEVNSSGADQAEFFRAMSLRGSDLFRKYCGDRFVKNVTTGAQMTLVFVAKKTDTKTLDKVKVDAAVKAGVLGLFSVKNTTSVSTEQQNILNSYSFSTKCYTLGTSPQICGAFASATTFDINKDAAAMQTKFSEVRAKMFAEAEAGASLAVVKESMMDYSVPQQNCNLTGAKACPDQYPYFIDYHDRLARLRYYSVQKSEVDDICSKVSYWTNRCNTAKEDFTTALIDCMDLGRDCKEPSQEQYNVIVSAKNPGSVELWDASDFKGAFWGLDFNNLSNNGRYSANKFYGFSDAGIGKANDKISSIRVRLNPNWTIRMYKDSTENSPGQQFDQIGTNDISSVNTLWPNSNDSFSAFKLIPVGDI